MTTIEYAERDTRCPRRAVFMLYLFGGDEIPPLSITRISLN